jgi:peptidoglycan/LPS O-acetylase OafA/YrhL
MSSSDGQVELRPPRVESLTGLRWWAAFFVFCHHMMNLAPLPIHEFLSYGTSGVTFFFVLSGFVLTWSATRAIGPGTFYWRRFARIWPAHIVALMLAIPVFYSFDPPAGYWWVKPINLGALLLSVVLLQGWSLNPTVLLSGNPAAWTLSCEAFFYAFHPWVDRVARQLRRRAAIVACFLVVATAVAFRLAVFEMPGLQLASVPLPIVRSTEFLLGMGIATAIRAGWRCPVPSVVTYVLFGVGLSWLWYASHYGGHIPGAVRSVQCGNEILMVLYGAMIAAVASRDLRGGRSLLRSGVLVTLGKWSYAFYLVHATLVYAVRVQLGTRGLGWDNLGWYAVMLAASLLTAWALFRFVEHPLESRMRHWSDRRRARRVGQERRPVPSTPARVG